MVRLRLCLALLYVLSSVALSLALRCGWYQCGKVIELCRFGFALFGVGLVNSCFFIVLI